MLRFVTGNAIDGVPPVAAAALLQIPSDLLGDLPQAVVLILLGAWLMLSGTEKIQRMIQARVPNGGKMLPSPTRDLADGVEQIRRLTKEMEDQVCGEDGALQTLRRDHEHYLRPDLSEWQKVTGQPELAWHNHTTVMTIKGLRDDLTAYTEAADRHAQTVLGYMDGQRAINAALVERLDSIDGHLAHLRAQKKA